MLLPTADTTATVTYAFGEGIPAPGQSLAVAPGVQPFFHQASERSDRGGYFALGVCIAHLNHLLHAGPVRRQSAVGGVLRFIATSTPEHS